SALANLFHASTTPVHRALADAKATVDVLHALLERVGSIGVQSLEELIDFIPEVTPQQRRKRTLAADLPNAPGVYMFRGPKEEVLYVGTASDLRRRVRQYFTASETRRRLREMVALAVRGLVGVVGAVSGGHEVLAATGVRGGEPDRAVALRPGPPRVPGLHGPTLLNGPRSFHHPHLGVEGAYLVHEIRRVRSARPDHERVDPWVDTPPDHPLVPSHP
ncbi:GIY-YIG nuclease family protein, partial [Kibdelosporangium lantanae]